MPWLTPFKPSVFNFMVYHFLILKDVSTYILPKRSASWTLNTPPQILHSGHLTLEELKLHGFKTVHLSMVLGENRTPSITSGRRKKWTNIARTRAESASTFTSQEELQEKVRKSIDPQAKLIKKCHKYNSLITCLTLKEFIMRSHMLDFPMNNWKSKRVTKCTIIPC